MELTQKLTALNDTDVVEATKKELVDAFEIEKSKAFENGKNEMIKQNASITVKERSADDPNRMGNFLWHLGKNGLVENQPVLVDYQNNQKTYNAIGAHIMKNMSVGDVASGGAYIPDSFMVDVIPALRNASVIRSGGAKIMPMLNGNLKVRKNTTGSIAYWEGELESATPSKISTGVHTMTAKKLICLVPVSNSLLRFSSGLAFQQIQADMIQAIATKEDDTFIQGLGTENTPKGLITYAHADNVYAQTATPDTAKKRADLIKAMALVAKNNVPTNNPKFIMDSRAKYDLMAAVDSSSTSAFPTLAQNLLWNASVLETNALAATSTSKIIFTQLGHAIIGQTMNMQIEFIPNATYVNGSGTVTAGTSTDESVFRIIVEEDFYMPYEKGSAVITGVTWGV